MFGHRWLTGRRMLVGLGFVFVSFLAMSNATFGGEHRPGVLLIQFRAQARSQLSPGLSGVPATTGVASIDSLNRRFGVQKVERLIPDPGMSEEAKSYGLDLIYVLRFAEDGDVELTARAYRADPCIESAEPDFTIDFSPAQAWLVEPDDPYFTDQWNLAKVGAPCAWDYEQGDSGSVMAVIEDGAQWDHEDLEWNLWINEEEDINGNHRFDNYASGIGGDLDSIDNDGNGYVDDVIGWDFADGDNDPYNPGPGPGTHTCGIAAAVTNNALGVSGLAGGWHPTDRSAFMLLRTYSVYNCISAIYYAAHNGADVINMSWGSPPSASLEFALEYAREVGGCILTAEAGNDGSTFPHYPAAYPACIAVAASDSADYKTSFSNYGDWVDVCAPGERIWSTIADNQYECYSSTGRACPLVAGLAMLIRAMVPDSSAGFVENLIFATCDWMPDSLYAEGLLGHGRINACRAVTSLVGIEERSTESQLLMTGFRLMQNQPNPFCSRTTIPFSVAGYRLQVAGDRQLETGNLQRVSLRVYDASGRLVRTLVDGMKEPGWHSVRWNGRGENDNQVTPGVYFYRLTAGSHSATRKMVVLR